MSRRSGSVRGLGGRSSKFARSVDGAWTGDGGFWNKLASRPEPVDDDRAGSTRGLCAPDDHQRSSKSRFSRTARNLSRILGLNDLSSASASKPSSVNSEGIEDKTLMTSPR